MLASEALRGNPLGDPPERALWVSVPAAYDELVAGGTRLPAVYVLQGYTGTLTMWANRRPFRPTALEAVDELFARPGVPQCLVVWVDAWTSLGGSQFLDSPGTGRYATYLGEVVRFVDARYATVPEPRGRAVTGKSSGGYGAMITALRRPDLFGALASHAGDALFECCYLPFAPVARALRDGYGGSYEAFLADFTAHGLVPGTQRSDELLIEYLGYTAAYSAHPDGSIELPFDPATGRLREEVWQRWLALDPVRVAETAAGREALRCLRGIWIDAGTRDEYHLDLGAEAFRQAVLEAGVPADRVRCELFEGAHGNIEYRYPLALEWLAKEVLLRE